MVRLKCRQTKAEMRDYTGIEPGLHYVNSKFIALDSNQTRQTTIIVEGIVKTMVEAMKKHSHLLDRCAQIQGTGSSYEDLKVVTPQEYDIDLVLKLPPVVTPVLIESKVPGFVQIVIHNFEKLRYEDRILFNEMKTFVDDNNYLSARGLKSFIQSKIDRIFKNSSSRVVSFGNRQYKINKIRSIGPAFTLDFDLGTLHVSVDLVPAMLLSNDQWPRRGFRKNPYPNTQECFFAVPQEPNLKISRIEKYWILSFPMQERKMIFHRMWLKPTIRVIKCIRDYFNHKIPSYALKTMFFWELHYDNRNLNCRTPNLWLSSFSNCVVHMLEIYVDYLKQYKIPYFWNKELNLIDHISNQLIDEYREDIEDMLLAIERNPSFETVTDYFNMVVINRKIIMKLI